MAVKVPETLSHLHYWSVELTRAASKDEVLAAFRASSRIAFMRYADGLPALNAVKELVSDAGRSRADLYEVAVWEDMLKVQGNELFYAYMVDNQAIVIPETVDAIRALTKAEKDGRASIAKTDAALGMGVPFREEPVAHHTVGVYVPGGRAFYPSSLMMGVVPARVAGSRRIVVATPPRAYRESAELRWAIRELGVDQVLLAGGGVRGWDDLVGLAKAGCNGALLGTAVHNGSIGADEIAAARNL